MFYAQFVLSKKGPLAKIWLAAHWEKKLTKTQVFETNVAEAVDAVLQPKVKMALRTTGHLLLGIVRIYSRKAKYLLADCNEAFLKIKMAFRPGQVDLPEEAREAQLNAITLPEVFHDFDSALPDFSEIDYQQQLSLNQSRIDDITMKEDLPSRSGGMDFGAGMDDFGDAMENLDDLEGLEQLREGSVSLHSNVRRSRMDGTRLSEGDLAGGSGMDMDTPIPDDFGGNLDDHLFMDEIFNDEAMMREGEELEAMKENQGEKAPGAEETLLLQNPDESFALEPLDATVMQGLEKHKTKRKRKLIVDETKNITGDEMKGQMGDYQDTLVQMDLAPPTKKLMTFKETGTADKFFYSPSLGDPFLSKKILKQFSSHLVLRCKEEDKLARAELLDELELAKNTEILEEPEPAPAPLPYEDPRLSAIPEEPRTSGLLSPGEQLPDQVQEEEPVPSVSPAPATSDRSESPPPTEKKEKQKRKSRPSQEHSRNTTIDEDDEEEDKEKKWNKRTHNILEAYRKRLKEQKEVTFTEMSKGATRKSAAQKFYMLLFLKKLQAIKFTQEEPFGEIIIKKGKELYKEL